MKNVIIDGVEYAPVEKKAPVAILYKSHFEVYPTDLGEMNYEEAIKACAKLGKGWRLPTRLELLLIYENKEGIGGFANDYYWSSSEYDNIFAWYQNFINGYQFHNNKNDTGYVRAIRDCK